MFEQSENRSRWNKDSILLKLGFIIALVLLLLIPTTWIESLITDRENYDQQNNNKVGNQGAGSQLVEGPVLVIPYTQQVEETQKDGKPAMQNISRMLYILPQTLGFKAKVNSERFSRSVYNAFVYNANITAQGTFTKPEEAFGNIDVASIQYEKASLVFNISDLKGLKDNPVVVINGQSYDAEPVSDGGGPFGGGFRANFSLPKGQALTFDIQLAIKGSNQLNFFDLGKATTVELNSDWEHPDYSGNYLPDVRQKNTNGYDFKWQIMNYSRPFPQHWADGDSVLTNKKAVEQGSFGLIMHDPVDEYRKVMRSAKYSILIILLTFVSLFLTEMIKKQRIHVFNYSLIGAAMVVYYTLLLSFSEQVGYNFAYQIASSSTITLISWFIATLLKNSKMALLFASILLVFYGFIFIIIQLEELSLLFGSVALFIIIAVLMYFSRKINWEKQP